jgi:ferredoxin
MIIIKKTELARAMARAQDTYILSGPVETFHGHTFRHLEPGQTPDLSYQHTLVSPKAVVFPPSDPLLTFSGNDWTGPDLAGLPPQAAVGIRPYDAKALHLLKYNFDTPEYKDPFFLSRFENLTLVGLAENQPDPANFSTSCGTGPFDETGLDMLLVDLGDALAGKILTDKGEAFARAAGLVPVPAEKKAAVASKIAALKTRAEKSMTSPREFGSLDPVSTLDLYEQADWEALAFGCINCNTCTFVCPTCWCFDIQDEARGQKGVRLKLWDSCMSALYSAHASGHNPRQQGWQRFRNRFMHKLKYFADKYGAGPMCVGCGRCIRLCPAGIDIRTIHQALSRLEAVT